jgi:enterochelin esterase-like enzyme
MSGRESMNNCLRAATALIVVIAAYTPLYAQVRTEAPPIVEGAKPVAGERIKIHGTALEANLEGNAVNRDVLVFLPPSYQREQARRYPVVYALHGFFVGAEQWSQEIHVPQTIEGAFALGAKEMIVVLPDSKTLHNGSMYSSSVTTGDFETFIARDVAAYIDAHYRTLPARESRGLVGHSMGGYGAARIGMKHPDVFGSLYMMSPCCLSPRDVPPPELQQSLALVKRREDLEKQTFRVRATLASAAAWSPNPKNPPFFFDLPFKDGEPQPEVLAKWAANAPLAFLDQYIMNLRRYHAIALDVGDEDGLRVDTAKLHKRLSEYRIGLNHLDSFSHIGGFSGAGGRLVLGDRKLDPKVDYNGIFADPAAFAKKVHLLWLGVGTAEPERMREGIRRFHRSLEEAGIQHVYVESQGTDHEWQTWRRALKDFAPRLFRK